MSIQRVIGKHRKLLASIFISGAIKGAGALFTFLSFVAIARATSLEGYGRFSVAFALATIFSFFLLGGQHRIVLKYLPKYELENDEGKAAAYVLRRALRNLVRFILAGAALLLFLGFAADAAGVELKSDVSGLVFILAIVLGATVTLAEFLSNYYRARDFLIFGLVPRDVVWRLASCLVFGTLLWLASGWQFRAEVVTSAQALGIVTGLLLLAISPQLIGLARYLRHSDTGVPAAGSAVDQDIKRSTGPFWGISLVWPIQSQIGVVLVGSLLGAAEVGAYFSAQKLSGLLAIISIGINQAIAPKLSKAIAAGKVAEVRQTFLVACAIAAITSISVFAALTVFGGFFLAIFDPAYSAFYGVLLILCLSQVIYNCSGPAALLLNFSGHERFVLKVTSTSAIAGSIGIVIATVLYGVYGTATAVAVTTLIWNTIFLVVALRKMKEMRTEKQ